MRESYSRVSIDIVRRFGCLESSVIATVSGSKYEARQSSVGSHPSSQ